MSTHGRPIDCPPARYRRRRFRTSRGRALPSAAAIRKLIVGVLAFALPPLVAGSAAQDAYVDEIDTWHQHRVEELTSATGWLTLIGLFWLEPGENSMGSAPSSSIQLPADQAPPHAAVISLREDRIEIEAAPNAGMTLAGDLIDSARLHPDTSPEPTILGLGRLQLFVIERGGRFALRVRDTEHPARAEFPGIERFPVARRWRVDARLVRHEPPRTVSIPTVLGTIQPMPSPGTVVFELGNETYRLDAIEAGGERLYLVFADGTSGRETYGGGRFLYSEPVGPGGAVVIDFNKAFNPPCAFTPFATCPLPPRQNKLDLRVEAGEKSFGQH